MGGSVRSLVEAAEQLVLESQRKTVVPIKSKHPFVEDFREKYIETRLQFAGGLPEAYESRNGFGIDDLEPWDDLMPEEIARNARIVVGLIVSVGDTVFRGVEEYLSLREGEKRPDVCAGERFDTDESGDARALGDAIEERFHLVVCVVRRDDGVGVMFFLERLEPGPPYVSRAFFDGGFRFLCLFPDISMEHFEGEPMRFAIVPDEFFIMVGAFPQTMVYVGYHIGIGWYVPTLEQAQEDHRIRSAGTGDDAFFITRHDGIFRDLFQKGVFLARRHGDIVSIFLQCEEKCARL